MTLHSPDKPREECGVFAIVGQPEAQLFTVLGLHAQQHRGQEGGGIATSDGERMHLHKGAGLIAEIFGSGREITLPGSMAFGHVRYSTAGGSDPRNLQPLMQTTRFGDVALAHNGNLTNAASLRQQMLLAGQAFQSQSDSEVILHLIACSERHRIEDAVRDALDRVLGAYSVIVMTRDKIMAARDPAGVRPLVLGERDGFPVLASETCALEAIGARFERDVRPGEFLTVEGRSVRSEGLATQAPSRLCIFEYIYFMRPNSQFAGKYAAHVRERIGAELFREAHVPVDVVCPVPDSGIHAAIGYAETAGVPVKWGVLKSPYIGRTFIEPANNIRNFGVRLKLSINRPAVQGRRVLLVDDSIVRANTMPKIVDMLHAAGALEVHVRIASPAFRYPCFYGIDTPSRSELVAANHSLEEIREQIGCDSLAYLTPEGLRRAVGSGRGGAPGYCDACFSGRYDITLADPSMVAEIEGTGAVFSQLAAE